MAPKAGAIDLQQSCAIVEDAFQDQFDALAASVKELEEGDDDTAQAIHAAQVKHLAGLIARKGKIEKEILKHAEVLAEAYHRVRTEIAGAVEARVAALEGAVDGLKGLKKEMGDGEEGLGQQEGGGEGEEERKEADVQMALDGVVESADGGERGVKRKREEKSEVQGRE